MEKADTSSDLSRKGPPRIRLVGAWFDPYDPTVWSGLLRNLIDELTVLGAFDGYCNATPWAPAARVIRRWMDVTGRLNEGWTLSAEMRAWMALSDALRRPFSPRGVTWLVAAGGFGLPVKGDMVSLLEISPAQLERLGEEGASAFGLRQVGRHGLESVVRQRLRLHRRSKACCVVSSWAGRSLVEDHGILAEKVHVVGCGPNVDLAVPPVRDWSAPRFLFVGNDWKRKNGDAVVRAFRRLRDEVPAARLDIVGFHPRVDVEGVTGHGQVSFADPEGRPVLESLFCESTCFVMPSFVEPFGIVYVEAATAGMPSIATSVGGTRESVGPGGVLVSPDDDAGLLEAMRELSDPARARALGEVAYAHSRLLTWRKSAERVVRAVDPALADREGLAEFL